jgi:hypothetical protein
MSTNEQDQACATIVTKISLRQPLDQSEKAHLTECAGCMREVVLHLDQPATADVNKQAADKIPTRGAATKKATVPEPVRLALARGRQVLEREFGIPSRSKPDSSS